jgi:hypothetical protein
MTLLHIDRVGTATPLYPAWTHYVTSPVQIDDFLVGNWTPTTLISARLISSFLYPQALFTSQTLSMPTKRGRNCLLTLYAQHDKMVSNQKEMKTMTMTIKKGDDNDEAYKKAL